MRAESFTSPVLSRYPARNRVVAKGEMRKAKGGLKSTALQLMTGMVFLFFLS